MTLLTVALVPAVCEELVCRGLLLATLRRRLPVLLAISLSALIFAAMHLSLLRAAPTLVLGLVLAAVRVRTGSLWPPMVIHLLNNAFALWAMARPDDGWVVWIGVQPDLALGVAVVGLVAGGALLVVPRAHKLR